MISPDVNPTCSGCGGPHPFDTTVPSVVWNAVIRSKHLPDYLCLTCIVKVFAAEGRSFTAELVGDGLHTVPIEVRVNDAVAQDAAHVSEENTHLRFALFTKEARIEALEKRQQPLVRLLGLARANEDLTDSEVWNDECDAALAAEEKSCLTE